MEFDAVPYGDHQLPLPHSERPGSGPFSYLPGEPLADFMLSFDDAGGDRAF